jgi:hypothetical protein
LLNRSKTKGPARDGKVSDGTAAKTDATGAAIISLPTGQPAHKSYLAHLLVFLGAKMAA